MAPKSDSTDGILPNVINEMDQKPPQPHPRRQRVREVSSRFMSPARPLVSASSTTTTTPATDLHLQPIKSPSIKQQQLRLKTIERRSQDNKQGLLTCCAHENIPETIRSLDSPLRTSNKPLISGHTRRRNAVKLFKENGGGEHEQKQQTNSCEGSLVPVGTATDATKLLQLSGLSSSSQSPNPNLVGVQDSNPTGDELSDSQCLAKVQVYNEVDLNSADHNIPVSTSGSPFRFQNSRTRSLPVPDIRSSMPEGDILPSLSTTRSLGATPSNRNVGNSQISRLPSVSPCYRSLNVPLSSCDNSVPHSLKNCERPSPYLFKPSSTSSTSNKAASLCLPPQPTGTRLGVDSRKGRKPPPSTSLEQVHSLKLLHNHYLQWRFANAKAEASMNGQRKDAERNLYSLGVNIVDLRDVVMRKRLQVELLRRTIALVTIVEAQMPCLVEWSALEEDYTNSLSGSIQALVNSSLRLPVGGNTQVDIRQITDALQSALKTMEMIGALVERFMPKAEEMDTLISELARVISGERAIVEECSDRLFKTCKLQVEDCSLRGHMMQLKSSKNTIQP